MMAGYIISYVDDLRAIGCSIEAAWKISRWVASRLQYLWIQDAGCKRRIDNLPWSGGMFDTQAGKITKMATQPKWDKAKGMVTWF